MTPSQCLSMSTEEHINQLTAQVAALQAQLAHRSQSPPPPQPSAAPTPAPKLPKVATSTPFSGTQDDLDHFKAECSLYLSMRSTEFTDEWCRWWSESTCTTSPKPNTAQKLQNKTMREAESCEAGPPNDQT